MEMFASTKKLDVKIVAEGIAEAKQHIKDYNVILLGPQISYALDDVKNIAGDIPVELIPTQIYAMAKGEDALKMAYKILNIEIGSQQAILTGLISISAFMLAGMGEVAFFMDAKGLLGAILFGLIASELFIKLCSVRALNIKLPDGVPPAVGKSFAVFLPAVITLAVIGVGNAIFLTIAIVEPDSGFIVTGNNQLTLAADATAVEGINTALVNSLGYDAAAATGDMGVFTKPFFDSYMYVGGSGSTLGLLIMTLAVSKRRELKEVSKYAAPAGVFQINEPVIFGYPMVLNGMYAIPFIFAPILNLLVG
ncbi:hypothetical protein FQR65_LT15354 [Abscondita terminalis]|nr:hypothetical protein FQR65_LT15354 [Abscondita terminalis]